MNQKVKVLGVDKNEFEKDGKKIQYTTLVVRNEDGRLIKYKTNKEFDFSPYLDKNINLELSVEVTPELKPTLRAIGVVKT